MSLFNSAHSSFKTQLLIFIAGLVLCGAVRGQTTDYVYGIEYGQGGGSASDTWNLDQLAISVDSGGTPTSYAQSTLVDLTTLTPGWDSSATTRLNQSLNALALDPATNTLFFTYSYNDNVTPTAGNFTLASYALRYNGSGFTVTNIYNLTEASGSTGTAGVIGSGGDPGSTNAGSGWFTKGTFYNGSYYAGVQDSTDNLVRLTLGPGENSVSSATVFTGINHGGASANTGGDLVISGGNVYISGRISDTSGSTFATTTLANALNSSGFAWDYTTDAGSGTYYYQLGGLGGIPRLYGFASGGASPAFGVFSNYGDPAGSPPTFTAISGTSPVIFADLSDGSTQSIIVPEPGNVAVGLFGIFVALAEVARRVKGMAKRDQSSLATMSG